MEGEKPYLEPVPGTGKNRESTQGRMDTTRFNPTKGRGSRRTLDGEALRSRPVIGDRNSNEPRPKIAMFHPKHQISKDQDMSFQEHAYQSGQLFEKKIPQENKTHQDQARKDQAYSNKFASPPSEPTKADQKKIFRDFQAAIERNKPQGLEARRKTPLTPKQIAQENWERKLRGFGNDKKVYSGKKRITGILK